MDVAKSLVRCVARAFYEVKHILVIDAIMIHSALRDDDLAHLLGTQTKELHKLCGKLREDRMVMVHTRLEPKEGQNRPVSRTYYYVDFRGTVDAIKYRMHKLERNVQSKMDTDAEAKGYACPRCAKRFSPFDVLPLANGSGLFDCDNCGTQLVDDDDSAEILQSQERLGRLMGQMDKIIQMLRKIDELVVPANEFSDAIAMAVPVNRERSHASALAPGSMNPVIQTSGGPSMEVSFTSDKAKTAAELAAEREKKQAQAEQNALPVWHTQSTVSGDLTTLGTKEAAARAATQIDGFRTPTAEEKKTVDDKAGVQQNAIQEYYAALAAAKVAQQKADDEEEEEEEEDDDEDVEFEDLQVGLSNGGTGPPSTASASKPGTPRPSQGTNGVLKSNGSDSKGILLSTKRSADHLDPVSPGKKVKIQTPEEPDDSDEEAEFEDV